jgi:ATP dependent DNA ligase domain
MSARIVAPLDGSEASTAARHRIPFRVRPMLATLVAEAFDKPGWVLEEKYDGDRILAYQEGNRVRLLSRNGKGRLLTLERRPDGMLGECFFQKQKPKGMPAGTPSKRLEHVAGAGKFTDYVVGGSMATPLVRHCTLNSRWIC